MYYGDKKGNLWEQNYKGNVYYYKWPIVSALSFYLLVASMYHETTTYLNEDTISSILCLSSPFRILFVLFFMRMYFRALIF